MTPVDDLSAIEQAGTIRFDRVDPRILWFFPDLVSGLGGEPDAMLEQVGIDPGAAGRGDWTVSYRQMVSLLAVAAKDLDCPDLGMRLAKLQAGAIQSPLLQLFRNSATLGEALQHVLDHSYAHSLAAGIWLQRCPAEETVTVGHDILIEGVPDRRQAIEQILLIEYLTRLDATAGLARARRVDFRHQPMSAPSVYRANFGSEVRFGQAADAIVYGEQVLASPIVASDPSECRRVIARINGAFAEHEPPLHARVRGLVMHLLSSERCTDPDVAKELGLHPRTLHRKLRGEGTSFRQIKNEVRRDLLIHYLDQTALPIAEISERLGFAEQSAMTRFCRQQLAVSPTQRRAGRSD